jgi:dihydroorotate dehydrogenase (NAD+) catalytic subunit
VGIGGIVTAEDALEFILAGASAVQAGTAIFVDPLSPFKIIEGIVAFMETEGVCRLGDLVGAANARFLGPESRG